MERDSCDRTESRALDLPRTNPGIAAYTPSAPFRKPCASMMGRVWPAGEMFTYVGPFCLIARRTSSGAQARYSGNTNQLDTFARTAALFAGDHDEIRSRTPTRRLETSNT